jgi:hypothetical protein
MSNGKGDTPRPFSVPQETYASNWDKVFGKKNEECAYSGLPSPASYEQTLTEPNNVHGKRDK